MAYDFNSLTKQAPEASNRDNFYTDFEDVDPDVLHQITELTEWMRTKAKGSDVREVIAQLFERTWLEESKEGNANMEVAKARGRFPVLNDRLNNADRERAENARKLAQKANKDEVTNVMTPKGTLAYASLPTSGNQVGWYYYCPDGDGTHGAGNYVWNGTSWFFGGTGDEGYNLLKKDLDSISSNFQKDLDSISSNFQNEINILSLDKITDGLYLDLYLNYSENENYCVTDFIKVDGNTDYTAVTGDYFDGNGYLGYRFLHFYDKSKNIINSIQSLYQRDLNFTTPDNCQYVIIVYHALSKGKPMLLQGNFASARFFKYIEHTTELVTDIDITRIKNISKPRKNMIKEVIENVFLNGHYGLTQNSSYKTTKYIKVKKDTSYVISPRYRMYALFSDGGNALVYNDSETTEPTVIIPNQDGYIRITSYIEDDMQLEEGEIFTGFEPYTEEFSMDVLLNDKQKHDIVSYGNVLSGKKWVACGDSFTEGVDGKKFTEGVFAGKNKVYPFFIGERNNMTIVNEAVSGSSMTYISERHDSWENGCFSIDRYKNIPKDADYITLYFGINDDNYSAPVGTIDDTVNTTFYGAWNIVMEYLIENHPFAKIGIIITNGSSKKYTDAERAISRKWGIPYLDMEADYQHVPLMQRVTERTEVCQKALELRKKAFAVSDSNTHPNAKAHEYESTFIENWLRTL